MTDDERVSFFATKRLRRDTRQISARNANRCRPSIACRASRDPLPPGPSSDGTNVVSFNFVTFTISFLSSGKAMGRKSPLSRKLVDNVISPSPRNDGDERACFVCVYRCLLALGMQGQPETFQRRLSYCRLFVEGKLPSHTTMAFPEHRVLFPRRLQPPQRHEWCCSLKQGHPARYEPFLPAGSLTSLQWPDDRLKNHMSDKKYG